LTAVARWRNFNQVLERLRLQPRDRRLSVTHGVASFHNTGIAEATLMMGFWAAIASATVARASSQVLSAAELISNDDQRQEAVQS
jgi:hypothetical protein